jgi:hypothetical protein
MQDNSRQTFNNMQAENEDKSINDLELVEPSIFPGPNFLNWRKLIPNSLTAFATLKMKDWSHCCLFWII